MGIPLPITAVSCLNRCKMCCKFLDTSISYKISYAPEYHLIKKPKTVNSRV